MLEAQDLLRFSAYIGPKFCYLSVGTLYVPTILPTVGPVAGSECVCYALCGGVKEGVIGSDFVIICISWDLK